MLWFCLLSAYTGHILSGSGLCQVVDIDLSFVPVIQVRKFSHEMSCSEQLCQPPLYKITDQEAYSIAIK